MTRAYAAYIYGLQPDEEILWEGKPDSVHMNHELNKSHRQGVKVMSIAIILIPIISYFSLEKNFFNLFFPIGLSLFLGALLFLMRGDYSIENYATYIITNKRLIADYFGETGYSSIKLSELKNQITLEKGEDATFSTINFNVRPWKFEYIPEPEKVIAIIHEAKRNAMKLNTVAIALSTLLSGISGTALAQTPQIAGMFPAGAKAGQTVEVVLRGGTLQGAKKLLVTGDAGVTAEVQPGGAAPDEGLRPLVQQKCTSCHELRTPDNRTMTAEQWASTVERMITQRSAQLSADEKDKVTKYLQAKARAGVITAKITVANGATPGPRELRLVTDAGVSTAFTFEVGDLPEIVATEPNSKLSEGQKIQLPATINGTLANSAERDYFTFPAKKGTAYTFDLKAFRLSERAASFFNPVLYLYDSKGKELAKNLGADDLDPVLTWTAPADGDYILLVRDMLWKGNPASIYRLRAFEGAPVAPAAAPAVAGPDFAFTALPDTVNIAPGGIAAIVVRATKRDKLSTGITITVSDLPPGVTAEPCAIPPDDDKALLILRASGDAQPNGGTFTITGKALGEGKSITRLATPLESYVGPANGQRQRPRGAESVGIRVGSDPFTLEADISQLPMGNDMRRDITVKVKRQGDFKGGIVVFPHQLPGFMYPTAGALYIPPEKNDCVFTIVGNGNADHISRRAKDLPPMRFSFVGIIAGLNEQPYLSTAPITVVPK